MSVHAPSLPASPSLRAADVRRMFQTPTTSVAGPSTVSPAQSGSSPSLAAVNTNAALHHHGRRPHVSRNRFHTELSQCLYDFVIQLLPTAEELRIKEDVRKLLERLIRTIEPSSRLLSFGSMANGFALRNSDMDLCCLIDSDQQRSAADLVSMLGGLLERETKFTVKPLPYARIPIVKLSLDPSAGLPQGIACDIGFENKLALENTRLLMCYAMIDPARVRTMVLFLKVWSKRRKINSPYRGTLSSYGYVLMVLFFLTHVKNPPVLPNLQQIPPLRPMPIEDMQLNGNNIWFFDDVELLRTRWQSQNTETVAELLSDFFKYYSRDFSYNTSVISLRAGAMRKEAKGWQSTTRGAKYEDPRERNRFCIEDVFETEFNVARCVSKDGLYLLRGEFMRAHRIFQNRPDRSVVALQQLCEERQQEELPPLGAVSFIPARPPPQTPYTVGGSSMRPQMVPAPIPEETNKIDAPALQQLDEGSSTPSAAGPAAKNLTQPADAPTKGAKDPTPPDHMAPRRSQYTSPPIDASIADLAYFEVRFDQGLLAATAATEARQRERTGDTSASASEIFTDDGRISDVADMDDVRSVRSFTDEPVSSNQWSPQPPALRPPTITYSYSMEGGLDGRKIPASPLSMGWSPNGARASSQLRGRRYGKTEDDYESSSPLSRSPLARSEAESQVEWPAGPSRRSASGPPRALNTHRYSLPVEGFVPVHPMMMQQHSYVQPNLPPSTTPTSTVFYETGTSPSKGSLHQEGSPVSSQPASPATYAQAPRTFVPVLAHYPQPIYPHHLMDPRMYAYATATAGASPLETASPTTFARWGAPSHEQLTAVAGEGLSRQRTASGPKTPTPTAGRPGVARKKSGHSHSPSASTIVGAVSEGLKLNPTAMPSPERANGRKTKSASRSSSLAAPSTPASSSDTSRDASEATSASSDTLVNQPCISRGPDRWSPSPISRRADSPQSMGTDSPAPSSPASSSYITSPSTSPPSPAHDPDKNAAAATAASHASQTEEDTPRTALPTVTSFPESLSSRDDEHRDPSQAVHKTPVAVTAYLDGEVPDKAVESRSQTHAQQLTASDSS